MEARRRFADWLATPRSERRPETLKAVATEIGVSYESVKRWKNDSRLIAEVSNRVGRHLDIEALPDIIDSLHAQATNPDSPRSVSAAKTLLDYLRWNVERNEKLASAGLADLSDDELRDMMLDALDVIDARATRAEVSHH